MQRAQNERTGIPVAFSTKIGNFLEHYSGRVILIVAALTLLLIVPLLIMGSDEQASNKIKALQQAANVTGSHFHLSCWQSLLPIHGSASVHTTTRLSYRFPGGNLQVSCPRSL